MCGTLRFLALRFRQSLTLKDNKDNWLILRNASKDS